MRGRSIRRHSSTDTFLTFRGLEPDWHLIEVVHHRPRAEPFLELDQASIEVPSPVFCRATEIKIRLLPIDRAEEMVEHEIERPAGPADLRRGDVLRVGRRR